MYMYVCTMFANFVCVCVLLPSTTCISDEERDPQAAACWTE